VKESCTSIDEYIGQFPKEVQSLLSQLRETIHQAAPLAEECINYAMPTFKLHGNLVHFAVFKKHIGFYPAPSGVEIFKEEIKDYKTSKGAIQFPLDRELPLDLISKIIIFRVAENTARNKSEKL
jgi:uncharacterized protein YdhG (YjbR/CyaY superfamily)